MSRVKVLLYCLHNITILSRITFWILITILEFYSYLVIE